MRVDVHGRHFEVTAALRRLVDGKLSKLERLLNNQALSAQAVLTRERGRNRIEITLHARGDKFLHGLGFAPTWELAVGEAIDKIAQQAQKVKGKWQVGKRRTIRTLPSATTPEASAVRKAGKTGRGIDGKATRTRLPRVVRMDSRPLKPMTVADAARELDAAKDAAGVVVFRDRETEAISVLYRRQGELTLVKTEA
jgi:ribosomal subunit interface protein